ncbi:MAG: SOS response-associated peptidase [Thermoanaerobaculia bacterium]
MGYDPAVCGRYSLTTPRDVLVDLFDLADAEAVEARYNIAPTQEAAVVRESEGRRTLEALRWGLVPSWADDPSIGGRLINARSESAAEKPSFAESLRERRCLVPADGFYEWKPGPGRTRQPFWIRRPDGSPFAMAGLWDRWGSGDEALESFTILTTAANERLAPLHDRMPVLLPPDEWGRWLAPGASEVEALRPLLAPAPPEALELVPVSDWVNSVANEGPRCIERTEPAQASLFG